MSVSVLLMNGTVVSRNPGILVFRDNPASYVQADGRNNRSSVLPD